MKLDHTRMEGLIDFFEQISMDAIQGGWSGIDVLHLANREPNQGKALREARFALYAPAKKRPGQISKIEMSVIEQSGGGRHFVEVTAWRQVAKNVQAKFRTVDVTKSSTDFLGEIRRAADSMGLSMLDEHRLSDIVGKKMAQYKSICSGLTGKQAMPKRSGIEVAEEILCEALGLTW